MRHRKIEIPPIELLEEEVRKEQYRSRFSGILRSTLYSLLVVVAVAVIVAMMILPVVQIIGTSMTDTLHDGDVVVAMRASDYTTGDVVAFYYNNNILIKRVIAKAGDWVNIDADGNVYVNGILLDEPYVSDRALGETNIELPYQVPEGRYFLMGDHRSTSIDSRNTTIGSIDKERMIGKLLFRVWPFSNISWIG